MKNHSLKLVDVNLSIFSVNLNKNEAIIEILNMDNGNEVCTIKVSNIITLQYKNNINEKDILPAYIGELEISKNIDNGIYSLKIQGWVDFSLISTNCSINYPHTT